MIGKFSIREILEAFLETGIWSSFPGSSRTIREESHVCLWLSKVKFLLERHGFAEVWQYPESVKINSFIAVLKTRLIETFLTEARVGIRKSLDCKNEIAPYLTFLCNEKYRNALAKIHLSLHPLKIEAGRHNDTSRVNRKCSFCDLNEDEYHFIIICPLYSDLRKDYIPEYYIKRPSMYKFITLLECTSVKRLKNLAMYVIKAMKQRNSTFVNDTS